MSDNLGNLWGEEAVQAIKQTVTPLPEDPGAEKAFIGCILSPGNEQMVLESTAYLDPQHFHVPQYALLYRAALDCANSGIEISAVSICDQLGNRASMVGGFPGVVELIYNASDYMDPKPLGDIIRTKWEARTAIKALEKARKAIEFDGEVGSSLDSLQAILGALTPSGGAIISHADLLDKASRGEAILPPEQATNKAHFGLPIVDIELNATARRLGVIAAKTSAGKSSISYQICVQTALRDKRVLLVSLESDAEEVASALAANISGMSRSDIMRRGTQGFDSMTLDKVKANVSGYYAGSGATWESLETAIRAEHRRRPFDLVIVDYFTLLNPPDYKGRNMASLYGEISKASKRLAQELEIGVILLSQFNRGVDDGEEPHLENLRETGQLEQDADWVLLMWAKADDEADGTRQVYIKGAKNRGGKRGFRCRTIFRPACSKFVQDDRETEPTPEVKKAKKRMG